MKKPRVIFVPADANNEQFYQQFKNSLRKFHSEEELPLVRISETGSDPNFWYRAKPIIAKKLIEEYETVIGADADQVITGDLSDIWTGDFDVGVVQNDPNYPIQLWDIAPYANNGLVVMKNKEFIEHWFRLCHTQHFNNYQFREQDLLNILISNYHNYKVRWLEDKAIYGEAGKPRWADARMDGDKIKVDDIELKVIHFGGGNAPDKGNFKIRFQPKVVERIQWLIK